jgi:membrane protease YdiL (CAAX protease family)
MLSPKPWRLEAVVLLLAGICAGVLLATLLAGLLHHVKVAGFRGEDSLGVIMLGTLGLHGVALVLGAVFLRYHHVGWRELLGLLQPNFGRLIVPMVVTVVFILPTALLLQWLCSALLMKAGYAPKDQEAVDLLINAHSRWVLAYLIFFATVLAPVAEEFIFRGVLYPFVKQLKPPAALFGEPPTLIDTMFGWLNKLGFPRIALIGVSLLFALIHLDGEHFALAIILPLFVFALAQTWLYERTDSLIAPMITHSTFNLVNLLLMFCVNGLAAQPGGHP